MTKPRELFKADSIRGKMARLLMQMFIPLMLLFTIILVMVLTRNIMIASVNGNIADASGFNREFKEEVDLEMYLYVTGYNDELPYEDVDSARELAENLLERTRNDDSRKSMKNVLILCDNLSQYMKDIEQTEPYDERMQQLENNIYGITQLIEDNFYSYLYHEAGELASIQKQLDLWLMAEISFVILVILVGTPIVLKRAVSLSRSITDPIIEMNSRVEAIGDGDLSAHTPVKTDDRNLALLSMGIEDMAERLSKQIELNRQEQIHLREKDL